jgi:hypothetical protein
MSISQANGLTTGSLVYFKDLTTLLDMAATVSAVTPKQSVSINVTTPNVTHVYPLTGDGTITIPVFLRN